MNAKVDSIVNRMIAEHDRAWRELNAKDEAAKAESTLVGRFITEPYADGCAVYNIVKEGEETVDIESVDIDDGWTVPYWGLSATIERAYAENSIERREKIQDLFSR